MKILGWINGNCQQSWCGDTYVFPGQLAKNKEWFQKISDNSGIKKKLLEQIEKLQQQVRQL